MVYLHKYRKLVLTVFGALLVIYLLVPTVTPTPLERTLRSELEVCEMMDGMAQSLRDQAQLRRIELVKELQAFGLDKRIEFQTPLAELVEAEVSGDRGVSVGIRNEISQICAEIERELVAVGEQ